MILIWNRAYDRPRVMRALNMDMPMEATSDTMDAFHVCFNAFKRKLGFATSMLPSSWRLPMWKHTSGTEAARYSALDALALLRNYYDLQDELDRTQARSVWTDLHERLDPILDHMSAKGMRVDRQVHGALRSRLRTDMERLGAEMTAVVPEDVRSPKVWTTEERAVKGQATMVARLKRIGEVAEAARIAAAPLFTVPATKQLTQCGNCETLGVKKPHVTRKFLKEQHG